jgi:hypothetical protein
MDEIRFSVTREDYQHLMLFVLVHRPMYFFWLWLSIIYMIGVGIYLTVYSYYPNFYVMFFLVLFILLLGFRIWRTWSRGLRSFLKAGTMFITISPQDLHVKNENVDTKISWRIIKRIFQDKHSFYFQIENTGSRAFRAYVIPRSAFASPEEAESFGERARGYWQEQQPGQTATMQG